MNKEIEEILELYSNNDIEYYNLCGDLGYDKLLDYITNLQEENYNLLKKSYKDDVSITRAINYVTRYLSEGDKENLLAILEGSKNDNI